MNIAYLLYQAERPHSPAEHREIDAQAGELAAAIAGLGRAGRRTVTRHRGTGHGGTGRRGTGRSGRHATPAPASCAIPSPR